MLSHLDLAFTATCDKHSSVMYIGTCVGHSTHTYDMLMFTLLNRPANHSDFPGLVLSLDSYNLT